MQYETTLRFRERASGSFNQLWSRHNMKTCWVSTVWKWKPSQLCIIIFIIFHKYLPILLDLGRGFVRIWNESCQRNSTESFPPTNVPIISKQQYYLKFRVNEGLGQLFLEKPLPSLPHSQPIHQLPDYLTKATSPPTPGRRHLESYIKEIKCKLTAHLK